MGIHEPNIDLVETFGSAPTQWLRVHMDVELDISNAGEWNKLRKALEGPGTQKGKSHWKEACEIAIGLLKGASNNNYAKDLLNNTDSSKP